MVRRKVFTTDLRPTVAAEVAEHGVHCWMENTQLTLHWVMHYLPVPIPEDYRAPCRRTGSSGPSVKTLAWPLQEKAGTKAGFERMDWRAKWSTAASACNRHSAQHPALSSETH